MIVIMYSFTLCSAFVCGIPNMLLTEGVAESHVVEKLWCFHRLPFYLFLNQLLQISIQLDLLNILINISQKCFTECCDISVTFDLFDI